MATTGFRWERPWESIVAEGIERGALVVLVNSLPVDERAVAAVEELRSRITAAQPTARVRVEWLDPRLGVEGNVARLRRIVEEDGPGRAVIHASGGLRWLTMVAVFLAMALEATRPFRGVAPRLKAVFEMDEPRAPRDPLIVEQVPPLARVHAGDLEVLRVLGEKGPLRLRDLARELGVPQSTLYKRLERLAEKGLVASEARGRSKVYRATATGIMLS